MTEQTEWRAEEYRWSGDPTMKAWAVIEYEAGTDTIIRHIAEGLDEPTARLIAAAPAKAALCEELADALRYARRFLNKHDHDVAFIDDTLKKVRAGRAPG